MGISIKRACFFAALAAASITSLSARELIWSVDQHLRTSLIDDVQLSPDNTSVAFTMMKFSPGGSPFPDSAVYVATAGDLSGKMQRLSSPNSFAFRPKWSPDGEAVAYIENGSLWVGAIGAAVPVSELLGVRNFEWAPDSARIAVTAQGAGPVAGETATPPDAPWYEYKPEARYPASELYILELGERPRVTQISREGVAIGHDFANGISWSPDGRRIAFVEVDGAAVGKYGSARIALYDFEAREQRIIGAPEKADAYDFNPIFSPSGDKIAFARGIASRSVTLHSRAHVYDIKTDSVKALSESPNDAPILLGWAPEGDKVWAAEISGVGSALVAFDLNGGHDYIRLPKTVRGLDLVHFGRTVAMNRDGQSISLSFEDVNEPPEPYIYNLKTGEYRQLLAVNDNLPISALPQGRVVKWTSKPKMKTPAPFNKRPAKLEMEGVLIEPDREKFKGPRPLIVFLHGGPPNVARKTFIGYPYFYPLAAFTELGYAVFRPNYRGSHGYGEDFRAATAGAIGYGDAEDVLSGIDMLIDEGVANPDRLALVGWSYGGLLTASILGHTDRFKVASFGAGTTSLLTFTSEGDMPELYEHLLGEKMHKDPVRFYNFSPLVNASRIKTPTLIQHGELDERVPVTEAKQLYWWLRRNDVDTKAFIYKDAGHAPVRTDQMRHVLQSNLDWIRTYIDE